MADKQIIIDDVDIAGCEFAVKPINDNRIKCHCAKGLLQLVKMQEQPESIKSGLCENNPDCYFKQLSRKTQEYEEFKDKIKYMEEYIKTVENARDELERENKFLKEENAEIRKYKYEQDFLQQQLDQLKASKEQAEQKLERIRELLTNITEAGLCEAKECGCDDNKECLECTLNEIKDVIQIID